MTEKIDLNELIWEHSQALYLGTDNLRSIRQADAGGDIAKVVVGIVRIGKGVGEPRLVVFMKNGTVFRSEYLTEWHMLDRIFGRENWEAFIHSHKKESKKEET